jgi:hypothetical protein
MAPSADTSRQRALARRTLPLARGSRDSGLVGKPRAPAEGPGPGRRLRSGRVGKTFSMENQALPASATRSPWRSSWVPARSAHSPWRIRHLRPERRARHGERRRRRLDRHFLHGESETSGQRDTLATRSTAPGAAQTRSLHGTPRFLTSAVRLGAQSIDALGWRIGAPLARAARSPWRTPVVPARSARSLAGVQRRRSHQTAAANFAVITRRRSSGSPDCCAVTWLRFRQRLGR